MSRGDPKPRGVPDKIAQAVAIHEAEPGLTVNAIAERCGISRSSVVKGLAANAARQAFPLVTVSWDGRQIDRTSDRLTGPQIDGLETWLQHVDPAEPVLVPQLVLDAVQALIEEVRERRAGDVT